MAAIDLAPASRRLGGVLLIAFLGAALVFFVMRAGHGDPALAALGDQATPEAIAAFHQRWGLDAPLIVQFWRWLSGALVGNFGMSMTVAGGVPIAELVASRLPNTLFIGLYASVMAIVISLLAGTVSALRHGRMIDTAATSMAVIGISMPDFWLAYVLIYALALGAGHIPVLWLCLAGHVARGCVL